LKPTLISVENALRAAGIVSTPYGAPCSRLLKKRVREEWEDENKNITLTYVWGMDVAEIERSDRLRRSMPKQQHRFPLIEKHITKSEAHKILKSSGIKRPLMYDMGYNNNNCIGCVRGGMGYWNKIRKDFPEVFKSRAKLERILGGTCIKNIYLDELEHDSGRMTDEIDEECGVLCEFRRL